MHSYRFSRDVIYLFALFIFLSQQAHAQSFQWAKHAVNLGRSKLNVMITDNAGNSYVTGYFFNSLHIGNQILNSVGDVDIFIAKYNTNGGLVWAKRVGSKGYDEGVYLTNDKHGNIFLVGHVAGAAIMGNGVLLKDGQSFIAKYDSIGNLLWAQSLGDHKLTNAFAYSSHFKSLGIDNDDNIYLTGRYTNKLKIGDIQLPDHSFTGYYVCKINSNGKVVWAKQFAYEAAYFSNSYNILALDKNNNIYIAGFYDKGLQSAGKTLTNKSKKQPSGCSFIMQLDSAGNMIWMKNAAQGFIITSLAVDETSNIYLGGGSYDTLFLPNSNTFITEGQYDGFIAKYDSTGNFSWGKKCGGQFDDIISGISLKDNNTICVVGTYFYQSNFDNVSLTNENGYNTFLALYDSIGTLKSIKQPNTFNGVSYGYFIQKDLSGNFYLAGNMQGDVAFGPDTLQFYPEAYNSEFFLSKFGVCNVPPVIPSPAKINVCYNDSATLTVSSLYDSYKWFRSGTEVKGATKNTLTARESGIYQVVVDSGLCTGISNTVNLNVSIKANLGKDRNICPGESLLLDPGKFTSYLWNDGSTGKVLPVNKAGVYFVKATDTFGCTSHDTVQIAVNAPPTPEITAQPKANVCPGDTVTLRLSLPYAEYQWYKNGDIMFGKTTEILKITDAGAYSVRVKNITGCYHVDTIAVKTTVLHQPDVQVSGPVSFCEGGEVILAVSFGYKKYQWYKDDALLKNETKNLFTASQSGKYTVKLDSSGCQAVSKPAYVNIYPKPLLNLPDTLTICDGNIAELDAGSNFTKYTWNTGDTTETIQVKTAGLYIAEVKNAFSCSNKDSVFVNIKGFDSLYIIARNDTLFASPSSQYQWYYEGTLIQGATQGYYIPMFDGKYTVTSYCSKPSLPIYFESKNIWKPDEPLELKVYPNPTADKVTVQFYFGPNVIINAKLTLHDALGKSLYSKEATLNSNFSQKLNLDMSLFRDGVYHLTIKLNDLQTVKKIVKVSK